MASFTSKKLFYCLLFVLCFISVRSDAAKPTVLVSLAPYKFFVEQIGGDTISVHLMVPVGASGHTYEPTPKEMLAAGNGDVWFTIGEAFETKAGQALQTHRPQLLLIDLRKGVDLISSRDHPGHACSNPACLDSHVWMSPKQSRIQARMIADTMIRLYPENKALYQKNLEKFSNELDVLDAEIKKQLSTLNPRVIMVSHPAYAYFCRDYDLKQISVEFEGRDPTPQQLTRILQAARENRIKKIFIQPQYNNKGARLIAETIGAKLILVDPYSEDYFNSMREIARQFSS